MARMQAEATSQDNNGGGAATSATRLLSSIFGSSTKFPDFPPSKDGCNWDDDAVRDLRVFDSRPWHETDVIDSVSVDVIAIDYCMKAYEDTISIDGQFFRVSSQLWGKQKPDIERLKGPLRRRSFKMLVLIRGFGLAILAEGVYYPTMH